VFVADVTLIAQMDAEDGGAKKKLINSNVAIEYGYALHALGDRAILTVQNVHYGEREDLPFDLKHKAGPIQFRLPPDATKSQISTERAKLRGYFVKHFRPYLGGHLTAPEPPRNFVVTGLTKSDPFTYHDHTGRSKNVAWTARIENRSPDVAVGVVCILDTINGDPCGDRAYLKWADQSSYEPTILPHDFGQVALFAIRPDKPGLFLQSLRDHSPREPIVRDNGDYDLAFKVFARDFPLLQFGVTVHLRWQPSAEISSTEWETQTEAELKV
jgi:hypothetical protein